MPKLLQITVEGNTGSTGAITEGIGELVLKQGWNSYIAHGRSPRLSKSQIIRIGSDIDIFLHGIETRIFDRHGLGSREATNLLICQIKSIEPDLIHLHNLHGYYINIKILFEYLAVANIPVVWTLHDCWSITGHCCHFDYVGCEKWKSECKLCPQLKEYPATLYFDRSKQNFHIKKNLFTSVPKLVIVSVSKWLGRIISESFFKNTEQMVIYNGIDINIFKPHLNKEYIKNKYKVKGSYILLGVALFWGKRKGLEEFIKLSKYLKEDEKLILVGLSNKQLKLLPSNIIGINKTENKQQLVDLYNAADVFLNLSVEESFGLTTAEALSCGTPAIVYNTTACPEIINSETGIIVEKNNLIELVKAISTIRNNGKEFYSRKCRARALSNFNKTERFQEYIELYNQLLSS